MENFLRPIYQERASNPNTLGILTVERTEPTSPLTDDFDIVLLIIVKESDLTWYVKHYESSQKTAALHIVTEKTLIDWIDTSGYRRAVEWIIYGKTVFDRNGYIHNLKKQLREFPQDKRNLRKAIDFGKLVKSYMEAKAFFEAKEYKDAHSKIMHALHSLARISVLEKGYYPEVMVWNQVKKIDIEVYKLYEEFIINDEEIDKRIGLMLIGMEYIIKHRTTTAATHLIEIMKTKDVWSYAELKSLPDTKPYTLDLSVMLSYLVENEIIELIYEKTKSKDVFQMKYSLR